MIDEKVKDSMKSHEKKVIWQEDHSIYTTADQRTLSQKAASMVIPKAPAVPES
jgi:hypothetical protein